MEYRIKEKTMQDDTKMYTPQKKFLWWFFDCTIMDLSGCEITINLKTKKEAYDWIQDDICYKKSSSVKYTKFY